MNPLLILETAYFPEWRVGPRPRPMPEQDLDLEVMVMVIVRHVIFDKNGMHVVRLILGEVSYGIFFF